MIILYYIHYSIINKLTLNYNNNFIFCFLNHSLICVKCCLSTKNVYNLDVYMNHYLVYQIIIISFL